MKKEVNNQTKATAKWQAKAGYVSKAYKLKKDLADEFKAACEKKRHFTGKTIINLNERFY